jgi:hypothetical protein
MAFRDTQLGRFGELCSTHLGRHADPDIRAAHAFATNGVCSPARPALQAVLATKLLSEISDPAWQPWDRHFAALKATHQANGGSPLFGDCPRTWPSQPSGFCMHELTPPLRHWSLRSFISQPQTPQPPNILVRPDGTTGIDRSVQPLWNYALTQQGEILVAAEDFGWIKHTSIAGGREVWAAGQIGMDNGQLRLVDLQSGHYVLGGAAAIMPGSARANRLIAFTEGVFRDYFRVFSLSNLHPAFACVWV